MLYDRVWEFEWLPGYLIKYSINRVEGARRVQECIDTYSLDKLAVPHKYLYHLKNRPLALNNNNYLVIVPKLEKTASRPLTLSETKQLRTLVNITDYWDFYYGNLFCTKDGKITLIDTELNSFSKNKNLDALINLVKGSFTGVYGLEKKAVAYIFNQIKYFVEKKEEKRQYALKRVQSEILNIKNYATRNLYQTIFNDVFG